MPIDDATANQPYSRESLELPPLGALINGRWLEGAAVTAVSDKYSNQTIAEVALCSREQTAEAVGAAEAGFLGGAPPPHERAQILDRARELLSARRRQLIGLMVAEAGFTPADALGDLERTLVTCRLCAEEATRIVGETVAFGASPGQHNRMGFTIRVPLGVICAITPFNSPLNTVMHKIGPALAAGNSVVLKPSSLTPLTAAALCEILLEAGLPPGLLSLVHGGGADVGDWLVADQRIAFYSFTGSTKVGRRIHAGAGLRRTQMELGSIASTIVCADADLDRAIPKIANAAFRKAGQVCTSVQRLYVDEAVMPEVSERMATAAAAMPAGDPYNPAVRVGPMIAEAEARRAETWIEEARESQARVLQGGTRRGPVLDPTVLVDVRPGMRVIDEEIFAPCVALLPFGSLNEAVQAANASPYGLAAGVFTEDLPSALAAARSLRFGAVHINETSSSRADGMPFGGVKESGFGHEGPRYAVREVTEERLVTFNP